MIAIDTNIIIRFLTKDDEKQYQKSYQIFSQSKSLFIPITVVLETEWVLRFSYKFPDDKIVFALTGLINLANVTTENEQSVLQALKWYQQGMDFADALHLACSSHVDKFVSFDKKFLKKASSLNTGIILIEP